MIDFKALPDERSKRFIAILNKRIEVGKLMNALGHMTAGLVGIAPDRIDMYFIPYTDKSNSLHPSISHFPFIVLKADNSNQIRTVRNEALARNILFTDFSLPMTVGSSEEQVHVMNDTAEVDLEYYGICLFGDTNSLREFTKKFSIFSQ